jgi:hypothetical protein
MFPASKGVDGKREWEYNPPKGAVTPTGLEQYIDLLRDEELEGLCIPPEVVQSAGNDGMGSATGRMVPLMAFIATLTPIGRFIISDFCEQILPILLYYNKMPNNYTIRSIVPKTPPNGTGNTPIQEKTVQDTGMAA